MRRRLYGLSTDGLTQLTKHRVWHICVLKRSNVTRGEAIQERRYDIGSSLLVYQDHATILREQSLGYVAVTGAYVEDGEPGWRAIHPVTSITLTP